MAGNSVEFRVVVNADGLVTGLKQVTNFGNETQKTGKKAKVAGDQVDHLNYTMNQGVTGASSAARSFSKLNQTIGQGGGGLVGAYATLAANTFAVSAAFNALRSAQQSEMVLKGLEAQGARTGRALVVVADNLRDVVGFGISAQESMQATALFTSAGFSGEQLSRLGAVAQNTSLALGRNLPDSLDRLIKGTTKLEPELLDELGIMTKLGEATATYALKTGKSAASLSAFERRQAFLNAVLAEGELKFGGLNQKIEVNPYDKLAASFDNLTKNTLNFLNNSLGVGSFVGFLSTSVSGLIGVILLFASTIQKSLLGSLSDLSKKSLEAAQAAREQSAQIKLQAEEKLKLARSNVSFELTEKRNIELHKQSTKAVKEAAEAMKTGTLSQEEFGRVLQANDKSLATHIRLRDKEAAAGKDTSGRQALIDNIEAQGIAIAGLAEAERQNAERTIPLETDAIKERERERSKSMLARAQETAATAIQEASERKYISAIKSGITATKEYHASLVILSNQKQVDAGKTGLAAIATAAFASVSNTAKTAVFGLNIALRGLVAGLLAVINVVGIAFLVFGALKATFDFIYSKLYPNSVKATEQLNKATEDYSTVLENQSKAHEENNRIMNSSASIGDRVLLSFTNQANSAIELSKSLNTLIVAREEVRKAELLDANSTGGTSLKSEGSKQFGIQASSAAFEILPSVIQDATTGLEQFFDPSDNQKQLIKTIDDLGKSMGNQGLQAAIIGTTGSLENFRNLSEDKQYSVLGTIAESNAKSATNLLSAVEDLTSAYAQGSTEGAKFFNSAIPNTPFDGIVKSFEKINSSLATFASEGKNAREQLAALSKIPPELTDFLKPKDVAVLNSFREAELIITDLQPKISKLNGAEKDAAVIKLNNAKAVLQNSEQNLETLTKALQTAEAENQQRQASIALSKAQAGLEQARLSKYSSFLNAGAAGMKAQLDSQEKINKLNVAGLSVQKSIIDGMITQKRLAIETAQQELTDLREKLSLEKEISLEKLGQYAAALNNAPPATAMVLKPGAVIPNPIPTASEQLAKDIARKTLEIKASSDALRTANLQSQALGYEIAAATEANLTAKQKAAKEAVAAQEAVNRSSAREIEILKAKQEVELANIKLNDILSRNNTSIPNNRSAEVDSILSQAASAKLELDKTFKSTTDKLIVDIAQANSMLATADPKKKKGIQESIDNMEAEKKKTTEINTERVKLLEINTTIQLLEKAGLADLNAELNLRQQIVQSQLKNLETQQALQKIQFDISNMPQATIASALGVNLPNQEIRASEFALKQAKESAGIRKQTIELEYQLLQAQAAQQARNMRAAGEALIKENKSPESVAEGQRAVSLAGQIEANIPALGAASKAASDAVDKNIQLQGLEVAKAKISQFSTVLLENFKKLGPNGEAAAAIFSGMSQISFAAVDAFKTIGDASATTTDKVAAVAGALSQTLSSVMSILSSISNARIAAVDKEIAAEQKRDGKSAESVAKVDALNKKKDSIARKSFNIQKKLMMAQAVVSTAAAIAMALGQLGPIAGPIVAGVMGAMGAAQIAIIAGTQYESANSAGKVQPPSTLSIGKRSDTVDLARGPSANAGGEVGFLRGSQGMGTNASNFRTIGSAYGGELMRGYGNRGFVVGEKGPEVITPETPINVTPANDVMGSAPVNATINIQALDASGVENILVSQKGNIIKMLRQAANASGQGFLEDVNVNVYTRPNVNRL